MCYLLELYLNYKDLGDQSEHILSRMGKNRRDRVRSLPSRAARVLSAVSQIRTSRSGAPPLL